MGRRELGRGEWVVTRLVARCGRLVAGCCRLIGSSMMAVWCIGHRGRTISVLAGVYCREVTRELTSRGEVAAGGVSGVCHPPPSLQIVQH